MDKHLPTKRKRDYWLLAAPAMLCVALILALLHAVGRSPAHALAPATPIVSPVPAVVISPPAGASDELRGVWQQSYADATIQLEIREWKAAAAPAVLYISVGRSSDTAIYEGRVTHQARPIAGFPGLVSYVTTFSAALASSTRLRSPDAWCRRLTGTLYPDQDDLDVAARCTDGPGRGIVAYGGGPTSDAIPGVLLDSGDHRIHLENTTG
jgi:hypothetical protein